MSIATVPHHHESYLGHVRHGVIVLDTPTPLIEGEPVRIEKLTELQTGTALMDKLKQFDELIKKWDQEDMHVTDDDVMAFQADLAKDRGLGISNEQELEAILLDDDKQK